MLYRTYCNSEYAFVPISSPCDRDQCDFPTIFLSQTNSRRILAAGKFIILKSSIYLTPICPVITYLMHERVGCWLQIPRGVHKIANGSWNYRRITVHSSRAFRAKFNITYICRGRRAVLLRRFGRPALRASTKLRRRRRLLKARYKFGMVRMRDPPETHRGRTERLRESESARSYAFMIAIMPNTISREILSAGRATACVANRAKNNNEMLTENKGELQSGWQKIG